MSFRLLGNRIAIENRETENVTAGGIILTQKSSGKTNRGHVVAVGEGELVKCKFQNGDFVAYNLYVGTDMNVEGREITVLNVEDVIAVLK